MPINKEKLDLRAKVAESRPDFKRPESWRYKRLETHGLIKTDMIFLQL